MRQITCELAQRNRKTLIMEGHEITKKQETENGNDYWKCSRWHSHKCKVTRVENQVSSRNDDSHEFPGRSDDRIIVQQMYQNSAGSSHQLHYCNLPLQTVR